MNTNQNILTHLQIVKEISNLPDDATVSAELAALFLGTSPKTLARLRQSNDGPPYTQYPQAGSKARNQLVNYIMYNLRDWRSKHIVTSTMDAAVRRGMAFSRVNDLAIQQPFWKLNDAIINHAFCLSVEELTTLLIDPNASLIWVKWSTALSQNWENKAIRESFHSGYLRLLSNLIKAAEQKSVKDD